MDKITFKRIQGNKLLKLTKSENFNEEYEILFSLTKGKFIINSKVLKNFNYTLSFREYILIREKLPEDILKRFKEVIKWLAEVL